jgi:hypothetical protein
MPAEVGDKVATYPEIVLLFLVVTGIVWLVARFKLLLALPLLLLCVCVSRQEWQDVTMRQAILAELGYPYYIALLSPFTFAPILGILAAGHSHRMRRKRDRALQDLCTTCGYDLTGTISGICPECGTCTPKPPPPVQ